MEKTGKIVETPLAFKDAIKAFMDGPNGRAAEHEHTIDGLKRLHELEKKLCKLEKKLCEHDRLLKQISGIV